MFQQTAILNWLRDLDLVSPILDELVEHVSLVLSPKALTKQLETIRSVDSVDAKRAAAPATSTDPSTETKSGRKITMKALTVLPSSCSPRLPRSGAIIGMHTRRLHHLRRDQRVSHSSFLVYHLALPSLVDDIFLA
jgi:hypothetical protein